MPYTIQYLQWQYRVKANYLVVLDDVCLEESDARTPVARVLLNIPPKRTLYVCIYLSIHLSIYLSIYLSMPLSLYIYIIFKVTVFINQAKYESRVGVRVRVTLTLTP